MASNPPPQNSLSYHLVARTSLDVEMKSQRAKHVMFTEKDLFPYK